MKTYLPILTLILLFISINSCKTTQPAPSDHTKLSGSNAIRSTNAPLKETYWKLIEVMGKPVANAADAKDIFVKFKKEKNQVEGYAGCNTLIGSYELGQPSKIAITCASTRMMCTPEKMEVEAAFTKALGTADSYLIKGDTLQLFRARMAPLARFFAIKK